MKKQILKGVVIGFILAVAPLSRADLLTFQLGGDRLAATQHTDGGWGWPLNSPPTAANILGPTAMGLAHAYEQTGDLGHYDALFDAGSYLLTKSNNFSASDGYLAATLDSVFGVTTYSAYVRTNFYDKLAAGTYQRSGDVAFYSTASFVDRIRTIRANSSIGNLAAWDVGMGLYAANLVGADTSAWVSGLYGEIDELDGSGYYDVIGLAGSVFGLASVGLDYDPTAGEHEMASNLGDLAAILASYQIGGGGFTWNSANTSAVDESVQESAYAILALTAFDRVGYSNEILGAVNYLELAQLGTGGWGQYVGAAEYNEITGEALWALGAASAPAVVPIPAAAPLGLLGMGLVSLIARRRKKQA